MLNSLYQKILSSASSAAEFAKSLTDAGIRHVESVVRGFGLARSLTVHAAEVQRDETHYLLIPHAAAPGSYVVYSKQVLPPDCGTSNSLPKVRVFHVPDKAARKLLEEKLATTIATTALEQAPEEVTFADRLDNLGEAIDRESEKVSNGLLIVGGVVALANPLIGVGIAANAIFPSLGAKVSKFGISYVADTVRGWQQNREKASAISAATVEVKKLKPEVFENPLLRCLDALSTNPSNQYDPFLDQRTWVDRFERVHDYNITVEAIQDVYAATLKEERKSGVRTLTGQWVEALA